MQFKKICFILSIILLCFPLQSNPSRWWQIYFTTPAKKQAAPPEMILIKIINRCQKSFYGAFYEISSKKIIHALINAKKRGVKVALVTDDKYLNNLKIGKLIKAGIIIVSDDRKALMHNKFAIIDDQYVWTGSYNLTKNGAYKNNNNAILIRSKKLAQFYLAEFKEMYQYKIFGNKKEQTVFPLLENHYYVKIGDSHLNVYFSPDNNVEKIIIKKIKKAKKSLYFMAFSFTSDSIGEAIIKKYKQGIKVAGIFEKRGAKSKYSEYIKMRVENLPVILDKNRYIMHHKVIIIDEELVITGSYNFSKNASKKNDENVLMIQNKEIAAKYLKEFKRLYR